MKILSRYDDSILYEDALETLRESVVAAVKAKANLRGASLSGADLREANLPFIPKVANLEVSILAAIDSGGTLEMGNWHTCNTTHYRAGWAIHLAGDAGKVLEGQLEPCAAGALIYNASCGYVPDFYAGNEDALADIRSCAAQSAAKQGGE